MYLLLCLLLVAYTLVACVNMYLLVFFLLIYALSYWDGKEYTGERRWSAFRSLRLWQWLSPIEYAPLTPHQERDLNLVSARVRRLYVMVPGDTIVSLVWGVGLHGGRLQPTVADKLHYIVPPAYLWIPILRDVLLWTGAITYHSTKRPLNGILLDMLNSNRSVCYCPSELANVVLTPSSSSGGRGGEDEEEGLGGGVIHSPCPDDEILSFALEETIQLVPVVVHGEQRRYHIFRLAWVQSFFYRHIGYPFPLVFFPRICNKQRPPLLLLQVGHIIECNEKFGKSVETLRDHFVQAVAGLTATELGDDEMKLL